MLISKIKKRNHALSYLEENGGAIVHMFRVSHASARKIFRKMESEGIVTKEIGKGLFYYNKTKEAP